MSACVPHVGCLLAGGYGIRRYLGKTTLAHRAAFHQQHGYFPEVVRHKCNNRACVNPDHLLAGTHTDNSYDSVLAGTALRPTKRVIPTEVAVWVREALAVGQSARAIAAALDCSRTVIACIAHRRTYYEV